MNKRNELDVASIDFVCYTVFTLGQKPSSTSIRSSSQFYDMCKQVEVDLSRIKKSQIFQTQ